MYTPDFGMIPAESGPLVDRKASASPESDTSMRKALDDELSAELLFYYAESN